MYPMGHSKTCNNNSYYFGYQYCNVFTMPKDHLGCQEGKEIQGYQGSMESLAFKVPKESVAHQDCQP
jgi:hypothetical protein